MFNVDNLVHINQYIGRKGNWYDWFDSFKLWYRGNLCERKKSLMKNAGNGLFAVRDIAINEIITNGAAWANDGIYVIENVLSFESILKNIEGYEDLDIIQSNINSRLLEINGTYYLQAIKNISCGEEITRYYGTEYWIIETIKLLSKKNDHCSQIINNHCSQIINDHWICENDLICIEHYTLELDEIFNFLDKRKNKYAQEIYKKLKNIA